MTDIQTKFKQYIAQLRVAEEELALYKKCASQKEESIARIKEDIVLLLNALDE